MFMRETAGSPEKERGKKKHLARSGSQSQQRICPVLSALGASHTKLLITILCRTVTG